MEYRLKISFDRQINHHHFSLKCLPKSQPRQVINDMRVYIDEIDARIYGIRRQTCRTRIILYFKHNPLFRRFDHPHSIHYYTAPFLE